MARYDIVSFGKEGQVECWGIESTIEADSEEKALELFFKSPGYDIAKSSNRSLFKAFVADSNEFKQFYDTHIFIDDTEEDMERKRNKKTVDIDQLRMAKLITEIKQISGINLALSVDNIAIDSKGNRYDFTSLNSILSFISSNNDKIKFNKS